MLPERWFLTHILNYAYVEKYYDEKIQFFCNAGVNPVFRILTCDILSKDNLLIHNSKSVIQSL